MLNDSGWSRIGRSSRIRCGHGDLERPPAVRHSRADRIPPHMCRGRNLLRRHCGHSMCFWTLAVLEVSAASPLGQERCPSCRKCELAHRSSGPPPSGLATAVTSSSPRAARRLQTFGFHIRQHIDVVSFECSLDKSRLDAGASCTLRAWFDGRTFGDSSSFAPDQAVSGRQKLDVRSAREPVPSAIGLCHVSLAQITGSAGAQARR